MVLKVLGTLWALIGLANLVMMPWDTAGELLLTSGLIFNFLVFVLPGIVIYGIGALLANKSAPAPAATAPSTDAREPKAKTVEERLSALQALKDKGLLDDDEYATRKNFILRDV